MFKIIKKLYINTKIKIFSKNFLKRVISLFIIGRTINLAISMFFYVDVLLDLLEPISIGYWFVMAFFSTIICSEKVIKKVFSKRFWYSVISFFVLGYITRMAYQYLGAIYIISYNTT